MPNKILLISKTLEIGGAERVLINLAFLLIKYGYEVHLLLHDNQINMSVPHQLTIHKFQPICRIRTKFILRKLFAKKVQLLNKKYKYKVIVSNVTYRHRWLPEKIENKTYYYLHLDYSVSHNDDKSRKKIFQTYNDRQIISVSQGAINNLRKHFHVKPKSVDIIYNFFDFKSIRQQSQAYHHEIPTFQYIIHVARFEVLQKRQDLLLDAFLQLQSNVKLVLLTPESTELQTLIAERNLQENVIIAGYKKNPYPWIKNAKLLVLCSDSEAFGNVLVESLICGTPVISTDCPSGPNEILTGKLSQWLVPCNNSQLLAQKIDEALQTDIFICDSTLNQFSEEMAMQQFKTLILRHK